MAGFIAGLFYLTAKAPGREDSLRVPSPKAKDLRFKLFIGIIRNDECPVRGILWVAKTNEGNHVPAERFMLLTRLESGTIINQIQSAYIVILYNYCFRLRG
jgi:hypothetical protein